MRTRPPVPRIVPGSRQPPGSPEAGRPQGSRAVTRPCWTAGGAFAAASASPRRWSVRHARRLAKPLRPELAEQRTPARQRFLPTIPREAIPGMAVGERAAQLPERGSIRPMLAEIASKTPDFEPSAPLGREWPDAGGEGVVRVTSPSPWLAPRALPLISDGRGRERPTPSPIYRSVCRTAEAVASAGAG